MVQWGSNWTVIFPLFLDLAKVESWHAYRVLGVRRDGILTSIRYERRHTRLLKQDGTTARGGARHGRCMGNVNRRETSRSNPWLLVANYRQLGYSLDLNTALHKEVCFTGLAMCMQICFLNQISEWCVVVIVSILQSTLASIISVLQSQSPGHKSHSTT
jgi:hypothetical protein